MRGSMIHYDDWSGFLESSEHAERRKKGQRRGIKESNALGKFHISYFLYYIERKCKKITCD